MEISFTGIKKKIDHIFQRYHVIMFVLFAAGGQAGAIYLLYGTVNSASDSQGYVSSTNDANFDQKTIDRINQLKSRDQNTNPIELPTGRTNPFVE